MIIGLCTLEFHLPGCRSLKEKRMFLRSLRDRTCQKYNVALAEIDGQDLWQRAVIGVVSIGSARDVLDRTFQRILKDAENRRDANLIRFDMEFL